MSATPLWTPRPDAGAMRRVADRRVHLRVGAEPLVGGLVERQMVRRDLDAGDVLVVGEEHHLLGGRDVEHVDALAGLAARARRGAAGRAQRGLGVAPDGMRRRIAGDAQALRSSRRYSSSEWKAARRRIARRIAARRRRPGPGASRSTSP